MTRDGSLDAFRGLTVVLMVLVNVQGSPAHVLPWLAHAEWDGLTLADLVFPWFLLIVGLSVPLALDGQTSPRWPAILRRVLVLFALGVLLSWLIRPRFEFHDIRTSGVLQRIALVYLGCALLMRAAPGWRPAAGVAALILLAHSLLLLFVPAPGEVLPSLAPGMGWSGWFDRHFLPGRVFRGTWDPEGVLSTLPALASGLLGVAVMRALRGGMGDGGLLAAGAALLLAGLALALVLPVNKALWTGSFVLVTAGLGLLFWWGLRRVWGRVGGMAVARWLLLLGQTALTLYVLHMLLLAVLVRKPDGVVKLWELAFAPFAATGLPLPWASLLFAVVATALCTVPLRTMQRKGWLIRA
ncbi:acyltransferase family protein [Sandaracinobacteroides saxicola]|uniref:DUF1624 domain-containing protein n=1 Tax=Sandaracinobacteroides saxicola TaxID=2759707 RepID=A0A7G5IH64_9SPHN|nr:heparan-alpha-glucosaminide N-acetyltransferase domain-containing protein [Sandaracinobacteroides saxicola]QMW22706.1 DUF1624 domain-containing protein [Sandaracinobacteroides saxicola]